MAAYDPNSLVDSGLKLEQAGQYDKAQEKFEDAIKDFQTFKAHNLVSAQDLVDEANAYSALGTLLHKKAKKASHDEGNGGKSELFAKAGLNHKIAASLREDARIRYEVESAPNAQQSWIILNWIAKASEWGRAAYDYKHAAIHEATKDHKEKVSEENEAYILNTSSQDTFALAAAALTTKALGITNIDGFTPNSLQQAANTDHTMKDY